MKSISLVVCAAAFAAGCSVNSATPVTAWGKKDVTMIDYRTDGGQCAVMAATHTTNANGSNSAGGINGQNSSAPASSAQGSATGGSSASAGGSASNNLPSMGGGTYRDSANPDFVNRAAMQQRSVEMQEQQARSNALKACLVNRGYTEFELTAEQRAELAKLPQGSDARREYLYKLGTDPEVLSRQQVKK